ncbi:MDR family oxidoreductase [Pusillimonas sp. ANT_WB101]|uniref:acrylyl-CoA reductase (NADPH) n=1 Tax=Pusillimonas sp. ANT_WB101 TaxID=2597356 RepID=UPI0011EBA7AC|nr:MDR family oxidoreductase [Pusillimonas sp. ANT_WB101]KAA0890927.1 oxidoreductase [Pusillimonas sp. ANT_WB101]
MFKAIMLRKAEDGSTLAGIEQVDPADLPEGEVEIQVAYSTLNYKDGLAITGRSPVVRKWPMVPGIDLAGTVVHSSDANFPEGSEVIVNGHGMGELHWGGLAQRARVPAAWLTRRPQALSAKNAMGIGTAGYTAMLSVLALERQAVKPGDGPVLVTGANGGVGSFSVALLAKRGYEVHASTGRMSEAERLKSLGAHTVIDRAELSEKGKPLQKEHWAGAIDCVGSHTLANVCAQTRYGGTVTACGLAQGLDFSATVAPFILRGIALVGIDSVYAPEALRTQAWNCLAQEADTAMLSAITHTLSLEECVDAAHKLLEGQVKGRLIVDLAA